MWWFLKTGVPMGTPKSSCCVYKPSLFRVHICSCWTTIVDDCLLLNHDNSQKKTIKKHLMCNYLIANFAMTSSRGGQCHVFDTAIGHAARDLKIGRHHSRVDLPIAWGGLSGAMSNTLCLLLLSSFLIVLLSSLTLTCDVTLDGCYQEFVCCRCLGKPRFVGWKLPHS